MHAIILAGGSGTRFWPVSRRARPKQLLSLIGETSMIEQTLARLPDPRRAWIVVGEPLLAATRATLPDLDDDAWVVEPMARNTAPAIALAALRAQDELDDEIVAVFPSDHAVTRPDVFRSALAEAEKGAKEGKIVTLGIEPTRPETGYGYIRYADGDGPVLKVDAFVEKPDLATAQKYVDAGNYAWNAGIFVFRPSVVLDEIERQQPELYEQLARISEASGDRESVVRDAFEKMPSISFDYAVMEGARNVAIVPVEMGWSDLGHWAALPDVLEPDENGNITKGDALLHDVTGSTVWSETGRTVACVGVEDLVVVDTEDAVLVLPRSRAQDVRAIVAMLEESDRGDRI